MRAYLFFYDEKMYFALGESCDHAADGLAGILQVNSDDFSVGGSWDVGVDKPLSFEKKWPFFSSLKQ